MKRVKVLMTCAVILLAIGGAFASKSRSYMVYTSLGDSFPGQTMECQLRGSCTGFGALCRITYQSINYQLYYTSCVGTANGLYAQ